MASVKAPTFPLTAVELARFARFADRGGIGRATALVDKEAQDGSELMFLAHDTIIVLMVLPHDEFIGSCEGVVGKFFGADVKIQGKLKRPVMTPRKAPLPVPELVHSPVSSEEGSSEAITPPPAVPSILQERQAKAIEPMAPLVPSKEPIPMTVESRRPRTKSADESKGTETPDLDISERIFDSYRYSHASVASMQGMDLHISASRRSSKRFSRSQSSNSRPGMSDISEVDDMTIPEEPPSDRADDWRRRFGAATELRQRGVKLATVKPDEPISQADDGSFPQLRHIFPRSSTSSSLQSVASIRSPVIKSPAPLPPLDKQAMLSPFDTSRQFPTSPSASIVTSSPRTPITPVLSSPSSTHSNISYPTPLAAKDMPAAWKATEEQMRLHLKISQGAILPSESAQPASEPSPVSPRSPLSHSKSEQSLNKLRKRPKQVPQLTSAVYEAPRPAPRPFDATPASPSVTTPKSPTTRFGFKRSNSLTRSTVPAKPDYGLPVSSKDFQEESVKLGAAEFEIVKPLAEAFKSSPEPEETSNFGQVARFNQSAPALAVRRSEWDVDVKEAESHRAREAKWLGVLSSSAVSMRKSKKVKALVEGGVPSSLRGRVWHRLAGADEIRKDNLFYALSTHEEPHLDRFLDELSHLSSSDASHDTRDDAANVLTALVHLDSTLQPYAGLVTAISALLQTCPAEMAFWTLAALAKPDGLLHPYLTPADDRTRAVRGTLFDLVLQQVDAALAKRLAELKISADDFVHAWTCSLFARVLTPETMLRAIDLIMFEPSHWVRVCLAVLASCRPYLIDERIRPDQAMHVLRSPPHSMLTPSRFISIVLNAPIKDDKLKKLYKKAEQVVRPA